MDALAYPYVRDADPTEESSFFREIRILIVEVLRHQSAILGNSGKLAFGDDWQELP